MGHADPRQGHRTVVGPRTRRFRAAGPVSRSYVSAALRQRVAAAARHRCGYCLSAEAVVGLPMEIEHIVPEALGGATTEDNLWLACQACNGHKSKRVSGTDPATGESVR